MDRIKLFLCLLFPMVIADNTQNICFGNDCFSVNLKNGFSGPAKYVDPRSCDYCSLGQDNTYCLYQSDSGPGRLCGNGGETKQGISESEKDEILRLHNDHRSKVANGQERYMPRRTASNMLELKWNDELARGAQLWANQCNMGHDNGNICRYRFTGQNLYMAAGRAGDVTPDWERAFKSWYDEVQMFSSSSTSNFNPPGGTGHFTQIVWAATAEIGCGYISYQQGQYQNKYYVCNYGPGGNRFGVPMFKTGPVCSQCPEEAECVKGLCRYKEGTEAQEDTPQPGGQIPGSSGQSPPQQGTGQQPQPGSGQQWPQQGGSQQWPQQGGSQQWPQQGGSQQWPQQGGGQQWPWPSPPGVQPSPGWNPAQTGGHPGGHYPNQQNPNLPLCRDV